LHFGENVNDVPPLLSEAFLGVVIAADSGQQAGRLSGLKMPQFMVGGQVGRRLVLL